MLVKLQRPPPEMRIFLPMRAALSRTATRRPRFPASMAQSRPAAPAPRIKASNLWIKGESHQMRNTVRGVSAAVTLKVKLSAGEDREICLRSSAHKDYRSDTA